VTTVTWSEKLS